MILDVLRSIIAASVIHNTKYFVRPALFDGEFNGDPHPGVTLHEICIFLVFNI